MRNSSHDRSSCSSNSPHSLGWTAVEFIPPPVTEIWNEMRKATIRPGFFRTVLYIGDASCSGFDIFWPSTEKKHPFVVEIAQLKQWLKWSCEAGGLTWQSQVGANPIPIPHPTNLALFVHKITLIDSIRGAHTIAGGGLKSEQGAEPLTLTTAYITSQPHIVFYPVNSRPSSLLTKLIGSASISRVVLAEAGPSGPWTTRPASPLIFGSDKALILN